MILYESPVSACRYRAFALKKPNIQQENQHIIILRNILSELIFLSFTYEQKQDAKERPVILGEYIIKYRSTVRAAAKHFGISKSTVHKDLTEKLPVICPSMFPAVKEILEINKRERHIRGGLATKHKYEEKALLKNKNTSG